MIHGGGIAMKTTKLFILILALCLFPSLSQASTLGTMRISLIDGDVQIRTEETEEWVAASINMPLREGDRIWVPEGGRTELQIHDGTYVRLDEKSALEILRLDRSSFQFYLNEGRLYANFRGLRDNLLQIDTPVSSLRAYERASFRVDVPDSGSTEISVYRGVVQAETRAGSTRVGSGKILVLREDDYAELSPLGSADEWERWNRERDRRLAERRPPSRYLPEELHPYARDFEDNGRWVYVREYGYVWTPTVVVSVGWAPYRHGRWVWIGGDFVWVSYEPWGWVPYHYGRWAFIVSIGWCWVPPLRGAVYWGPGFVGWVYGPTYVAWVPLAPGEIYYGYGYYGPHSVNITNVNITNIEVNKIVYKNVYVQNAVTVVHHETFVHGKHVDVDVKENPFLIRRVHVGRPDIKPERATAMPVVREVPEKRRPPAQIREIHVKELKEKRPMVRDKNASVMRPEAPPRPMTIKTVQKPGVEKPRESTPPGKRIEKPGEAAPPGKGLEQPEPMERETEKPRESKPPEKAVEKPKETRPPQRDIERPVERSKEYRPPEQRRETPRSSAPSERETVKPRESAPPQKGVERPRESAPPSKGTEVPRESGSPPRTIERPSSNEKRVEEPKKVEPHPETRPPEKRMERSNPIRQTERGAAQTGPLPRTSQSLKAWKGVERKSLVPQVLRPSR